MRIPLRRCLMGMLKSLSANGHQLRLAGWFEHGLPGNRGRRATISGPDCCPRYSRSGPLNSLTGVPQLHFAFEVTGHCPAEIHPKLTVVALRNWLPLGVMQLDLGPPA